MAVIAPSKGIPLAIFAGTTGVSDIITPPITFTRHTFYVQGIGNVNAGAVRAEFSYDPTYTGTWAAGSTVAVPATAQAVLAITTPSVIPAMRIAVQTTIAGGTATIMYCGS